MGSAGDAYELAGLVAEVLRAIRLAFLRCATECSADLVGCVLRQVLLTGDGFAGRRGDTPGEWFDWCHQDLPFRASGFTGLAPGLTFVYLPDGRCRAVWRPRGMGGSGRANGFMYVSLPNWSSNNPPFPVCVPGHPARGYACVCGVAGSLV